MPLEERGDLDSKLIVVPTQTTVANAHHVFFMEISNAIYCLISALCIPFVALWKWFGCLYRAVGHSRMVPVAQELSNAPTVINRQPHVTIYAPNVSISCNYFKSDVNIVTNIDDDIATESVAASPYSQDSFITESTVLPISFHHLEDCDARASRVLSTNALRRIQSATSSSSFSSVD